jgi:hypothetical protein
MCPPGEHEFGFAAVPPASGRVARRPDSMEALMCCEGRLPFARSESGSAPTPGLQQTRHLLGQRDNRASVDRSLPLVHDGALRTPGSLSENGRSPGAGGRYREVNVA